MSQIDIDNLSLAELKVLQKKVAKAIEGYEERQKTQALAALEAKAREMGFSLSELTGAPQGKGKRKPAAPKYRHPEDPSVTWTGKGRQPAWFKSAVTSGVSPDDLLV
ncbi:MAG: H-NS histone family protein [Rhodobacterales bacterium]|nr:H-NS histone family protein [Rhodobacterales bacterium]MDX5411577.1 H-NS histone family protein [Rhodobacterales bacterium]